MSSTAGPDTLFTVGKTAAFPAWERFYDVSLQEQTLVMYGEDFARYGYARDWLGPEG